MFLLGLAGSALATVAFSFCSDIPGFTVTWSINRYLQSMGWGALVKVTSKWVSAEVFFFFFPTCKDDRPGSLPLVVFGKGG